MRCRNCFSGSLYARQRSEILRLYLKRVLVFRIWRIFQTYQACSESKWKWKMHSSKRDRVYKFLLHFTDSPTFFEPVCVCVWGGKSTERIRMTRRRVAKREEWNVWNFYRVEELRKSTDRWRANDRSTQTHLLTEWKIYMPRWRKIFF